MVAGSAHTPARSEIADRDRQQIRRDGLRHAELVVAGARGIGVVVGAHQGDQFGRRGDPRPIGEPNRRRVLQRHPAARVDGLRLTEQESVLAACGHRRLQPLETGSRRRGAVANAHHFIRLAHADRQPAAEDRVGLGHRKIQALPGAVAGLAQHLVDFQLAAVEHQLSMLGVDPVQPQIGATGQRAFGEIDIQIEGDIGNANLVGLGIAVLVGRAGRRQ
jgi:hypothetical protein